MKFSPQNVLIRPTKMSINSWGVVQNFAQEKNMAKIPWNSQMFPSVQLSGYTVKYT